jgi:hypothetical protein
MSVVTQSPPASVFIRVIRGSLFAAEQLRNDLFASSGHATMDGMKTFDFEVILAAGTDVSEELADKLYEAGCDDGTPGMCCGVPVIGFNREAECLESAIRSAVADVQKAGCSVERVQIERTSPLLSSSGG